MSTFNRARRWLFENALPFWATYGVDRLNGGYTEHLALDASDAHVDFKRVRVIARQIYVFSHAALLGYPGAAELARHGFEFLTKFAWLGADRGWARQLYPDGRVKDRTPDLYDLAFVLYACGWYYRLTKSQEARDWAVTTATYIESHMRHPSGIGYAHELPVTGPSLQNPHMHVLEAALVNLEDTDLPCFRKLADEIVELFETRFFDRKTQTLAEYYDEDWNRLPTAQGRQIEPGHHFEWAWILSSYQRLTGKPMTAYIEPLIAFAERHGVDKRTGAVVNIVQDDGVVIDGDLRLWPNTERIQAAVALFETAGVDPEPVFDEATRVIFDYFLDPAPSGTWIDRTTANGAPAVDKIPASSLYHIVIAFAEMLRVEERVHRETTANPTLVESLA